MMNSCKPNRRAFKAEQLKVMVVVVKVAAQEEAVSTSPNLCSGCTYRTRSHVHDTDVAILLPETVGSNGG